MEMHTWWLVDFPSSMESSRWDETATMSLHSLSATVDFQIGQVPQEKLRLRTGIHTDRQHWAFGSRYGARWFWIQVLGLRF